MEKDWLIRTHDYQILGPVSKEKIVELIENGTLKDEDEISSGNGYWFWLKEKDLLDKYIYGTEAQTFNPANSFEGKEGHFEESMLPANEDLEYPEEGASTSFKEEQTASRMAGQEEILSATDADDIDLGPEPEAKDDKDTDPEPEAEAVPSTPKKPSSENLASFFKTFFLTIIVMLIMLIIAAKVFKYPVLQWLFPPAAAQEKVLENADKINFEAISLVRGVEGFMMTAGTSEVPQNCRQAQEFFLGVLILLDKRSGKLERWQSFLKECSSGLPKYLQAMLNVPDQKLQKYLKKWKLSSYEQSWITEIQKLVERQKKDALILGKFLDYEKEKKKTFSKIGISWSFPRSLNLDLSGTS